MHYNWKSMLPVAVSSLTLFAGVASADAADSAQMRNLENRVSALEQRKGAGGMINPQGRPQVKDGADLFIFADLLYWNAHENGLNLAVVQNDPTAGSSERLNDADVYNLQGKWNWGFRVGAGYNTMHDGWDLNLTWLRFTDTGHTLQDGEGKKKFYPSMLGADLAEDVFGQDAFAQKVRGYWGFNLNQIDLDLGREFFVSKWLTLRPHVGLRTDWLHQNVTATYYRLEDTSPRDAIVDLRDHWWGLGLEGGLDTQWGLGSGWSLFGNVSGAIVYGFHQISDTQTAKDIADKANSTVYGDIYNSYRISHPVLDFAMGVRWDYMFCADRFHVGFDLGWEHHVYFSQNQFPLFVNDVAPGSFVSNQGDLTLQGWTFSARFDF